MEPRILKVKEKDADEICRLLDTTDVAHKEGHGRYIALRKLWKAAYKACPEAAEEGTTWVFGMIGPTPVLRETTPEPKEPDAQKPAGPLKASKKKAKK